jgi:hypothetical protein
VDRPIVVDQLGKERSWDWLVESFGPISLHRTSLPAGATHVYRIVRLQDAEGAAVQIASVQNGDGTPRAGVRAVRHWPDAPILPTWPPPTSRWRDRGVFGVTNAQGQVGFGLGQGDYYFPPRSGTCALWIADPAGPSDCLEGLGMLGLTNHRRLDIHFEFQPVEGQPAPPKPAPPPAASPSEQWWEQVFSRLDMVIALLEKRVGRS